MQPEIVIKMIQDNLRISPTNNSATHKQKVDLTDAEIIEKLKTPKKPFTRCLYTLPSSDIKLFLTIFFSFFCAEQF